MLPSDRHPDPDLLRMLAAELARRYPDPAGETIAVVDICRQRLYLLERGRLVESYAVSTAARGIGNREGSEQTPLGVFRVAEKYGRNAPVGTVFKGRRDTGEIAPILSDPNDPAENDLVTTRILRLSGLQAGFNLGGDVDTFSRYIYIHGTPEEGRIGTPASHGCVRMRNIEVVDLFDRLAQDSLVCIVPGDVPLTQIPGPAPEIGTG
jgi:hypothetical protein